MLCVFVFFILSNVCAYIGQTWSYKKSQNKFTIKKIYLLKFHLRTSKWNKRTEPHCFNPSNKIVTWQMSSLILQFYVSESHLSVNILLNLFFLFYDMYSFIKVTWSINTVVYVGCGDKIRWWKNSPTSNFFFSFFVFRHRCVIPIAYKM